MARSTEAEATGVCRRSAGPGNDLDRQEERPTVVEGPGNHAGLTTSRLSRTLLADASGLLPNKSGIMSTQLDAKKELE